MASPLISSPRQAQARAQRQNILRTTEFGNSFNPSRSATAPATVRVATAKPRASNAAVNVAVRIPVAPISLYDINGKLKRNGKQDCRHNNCGGMTGLVDDNHSVPHANIANLG